jgi:hypothetical protein
MKFWKEENYLSTQLDLCCFEVISTTCLVSRAQILTNFGGGSYANELCDRSGY